MSLEKQTETTHPLSANELAGIEKAMNVAAKTGTQSPGASLKDSAIMYSQMMGLFQRISKVNAAFQESIDKEAEDNEELE